MEITTILALLLSIAVAGSLFRAVNIKGVTKTSFQRGRKWAAWVLLLLTIPVLTHIIKLFFRLAGVLLDEWFTIFLWAIGCVLFVVTVVFVLVAMRRA